MEQALTELEIHERELEVLSTILARREPEPVDWDVEFAPALPPEPTVYRAPAAQPTCDEARQAVEATRPAARWWLSAVVSWVAAWLAPQPLTRGVMIVVGALLIVDYFRVKRTTPAAAAKLYRQRKEEFDVLDQKARAAFALEEAERRNIHAQNEAMKRDFRQLEVERNFELATAFLEMELSNENLGVPITIDVEFQDLHEARLLIALPGLDVVPAQRAQLTKTGKLSRRAMAQRDRKALYTSICAGVALRLIYETFRVLPFVNRVQAIGTVTTPGLGRMERRYAGVALETSRFDLLAMDLDEGEPEAILRSLGGEMSLARDGTLKPLEITVEDHE
jgi:hypothetical protein